MRRRPQWMASFQRTRFRPDLTPGCRLNLSLSLTHQHALRRPARAGPSSSRRSVICWRIPSRAFPMPPRRSMSARPSLRGGRAHYERAISLLEPATAGDAARAERLYEGRSGERTPMPARSCAVSSTDHRVPSSSKGSCQRAGGSMMGDTDLPTLRRFDQQRVRVRRSDVFDALLADQPLTGGLEPMLGDFCGC